MTGVTFVRHTGRAGLEALRPAWELMVAASEGRWFHHLPAWYASYLHALESDELSVHFFAAYEGGLLCAVFPLKKCRPTEGGVRVHELVAPYHDHMPFTDFIAARGGDERRLLLALIHYLTRQREIRWDVISIPRALDDSAAIRAASTHIPRSLRRLRGGSDSIPLLPNDDLSQRLSRNFRGNLRKARNKLLAHERVEFVTARERPDLLAAFDDFLEVEASGWKGGEGTGTAIRLHPDLHQFYLSLIENFGAADACQINLLRVDAKCVGAQFCIIVGSTYYILKIGYDEQFAALAPGNMLIEHLLKRLADEGGVTSVNLVSDADWHENWRPERAQVYDVVIVNRTVGGLGAITSLRTRFFMKHHALPAVVAVRRRLLGLWATRPERAPGAP